jgi:hypothetical protein
MTWVSMLGLPPEFNGVRIKEDLVVERVILSGDHSLIILALKSKYLEDL